MKLEVQLYCPLLCTSSISSALVASLIRAPCLSVIQYSNGKVHFKAPSALDWWRSAFYNQPAVAGFSCPPRCSSCRYLLQGGTVAHGQDMVNIPNFPHT